MYGYFYCDGAYSGDIGLSIISVNGEQRGLPLFGGQSVTEQQLIDRDYPSFARTRKENIRFTLVFSFFDESVSEERLYQAGKFLMRGKPVEFRLEDRPERVLYVVPTGQSELMSFGGGRGYFQMSFFATTPYWLTIPEDLMFTVAANGTFTVENRSNIQNYWGNYDVYPPVKITVGAGSGVFTVGSVSFGDTIAGEVIEMRERMVCSSLDENIFRRWNKELFVLHGGSNVFRVNRACTVSVRVQFPVF